MYTQPFQRMPSSCRSSGCTGMIWYASFMSAFTNEAPGPICNTSSASISTVAYSSEQYSKLIPSLTTCPLGEDRLTISLHFPVFFSSLGSCLGDLYVPAAVPSQPPLHNASSPATPPSPSSPGQLLHVVLPYWRWLILVHWLGDWLCRNQF